MKLTVAIPTHNRHQTLALTLGSLAALKVDPEIKIECLVIDNNSTDATPGVVEAFARTAPFPARRVFEPRQGSSFARNRAVREGRGELIFFIDDDVIVQADWASELIAEIRRRDLDAACGLVLARWQAPPPRWLGVEVYGKLAVHAQSVPPPEKLSQFFSANVGLKRECLDRFGLFREDLGVVGGNPMSGEDTELFGRIIGGGGKIGIAPRAVVHHLIGSERMTRGYFCRKSFAFGVGSALGGGRTHNRPDKLIRNLVRMASAAARGNQPLAFYHQLECVNFFGYWYGRLRPRRGVGPVVADDSQTPKRRK
jgi:glycosyltransferase involved in cell wall biosynthesis